MFLGMMYKYGMQVQADRSMSDEYYAQARHILEKNAAEGDYIAKDLLGRIYYFGLGVKQDLKESRKWRHQLSKDEVARLAFYSSPSQPEDDSSDEYSVEHYTQNLNSASNGVNVKELLDAAEQGVTEAQVVVAYSYLGGNQQFAKSPQKALDWFLKLSVYGVGMGSYTSGVLIDESLDQEQNNVLAGPFYRQAKDLLELQSEHSEVADIRYTLGMIYKLGLGMPAQVSLGNKYLDDACNLALKHDFRDFCPVQQS